MRWRKGPSSTRRLDEPGPKRIGGDRRDPASSLGLSPGLHEVAAAAEHGSHHQFYGAVELQPRRPQSIATEGVLLNADASDQLGQTVEVMDVTHRR